MGGVSETQSNFKFGREARCSHAASDNGDPVTGTLKQVFNCWTTSENAEWRVGDENWLGSSFFKYVVGRREIVDARSA
jgi:hypothetical protein